MSQKSRREVMKLSLGALALLKCGSPVSEMLDGGAGGGSAGAGGGSAGGSAGGAAGGAAGGTAGGAGGGTAATTWANGTTALLSGQNYGNPFSSGVGPTCNVYKSSTEGPCHATSPLLTRKDVSEGYSGVPMRLELLVVNASCQPVPNAIVEIWMCDTKGVYSGDIDGNNDAFCTGGSATAAAALWGRGIQTAGSDGRVTFDALFPGWYSSRATHIHFRVSVGATSYVVSQLFFDEALKTDIYTNQASYTAPSGSGYKTNASDMVFTQSALSANEVVCSTARQPDGAMLAWRSITINS